MDSILHQLLLWGRVQFVHGFAFNRIKLELCQQYKSIQSLNHQCCLAWTYRAVGPAVSYDILFVFHLTHIISTLDNLSVMKTRCVNFKLCEQGVIR